MYLRLTRPIMYPRNEFFITNYKTSVKTSNKSKQSYNRKRSRTQTLKSKNSKPLLLPENFEKIKILIKNGSDSDSNPLFETLHKTSRCSQCPIKIRVPLPKLPLHTPLFCGSCSTEVLELIQSLQPTTVLTGEDLISEKQLHQIYDDFMKSMQSILKWKKTTNLEKI